MKRLVPVLAFAALSVAACQRAAEGNPNSGQSTAPPAAADATTGANSVTGTDADGSANAPAMADDTSNAAAASQTSLAPPQIALAYALGLVVPADQVRPLMESHQEACERAGPAQCQVMGANASADGDDRATAQLTLRATPAWMRMFRTRAEADAKDLGGKVGQSSTEGDDLSGSIVDTEAAQRTRAAERARLTQLMERKTKNLSDTLAVEQQITQVQGDMDKAASELAAEQGRVAMQTLTISYQSTALAASDSVTAPLAQAGKSFLGNMIAVLAGLIRLASFLLPIGGGVALVWWGLRRKTPRPTPPSAAN